MSTILRNSLAVAMFAIPGGVLAPDSVMTGTARQYIDQQCRSAALSITDPANANLEAGSTSSGTSATTVPSAAFVRQVIEWHYGPTPGRYVAIIQAIRANAAISARVTVDLRNLPCRLAAWQSRP